MMSRCRETEQRKPAALTARRYHREQNSIDRAAIGAHATCDLSLAFKTMWAGFIPVSVPQPAPGAPAQAPSSNTIQPKILLLSLKL